MSLRARRARRRIGAAAQAGPAGPLLELGEELRREGVAVGTSELLDAFAVLGEIDWTAQEDFREALAATLAKSQEDRRVFELVFDRFFFRAVELAAIREDVREQSRRAGGGLDLDELTDEQLEALRAQIAAALSDGSEGAMRDLARMAIAAFARRQEGSGVIGVDVQRIRRALGLRAEPQPELPAEDPRRDGLPRDALRRFEALLRRELERAPDRAHRQPAPGAAAGRARPGAALGPARRPRGRAPRRGAAAPAPGHAGPAGARPPPPRARGRRRTMRASLQTGGVPVVLKYRPRRPRRPEIYVLCDVSTSVTSASVFFLSVLHALHDSFRKMRSFVFIERICEVTDIFEHERDFKAVSERISGDAGVADISGYTDYGRVWSEFLEQVRGRPAPARDRDRARRRAHQRARPARGHLRPDRRPRRAHVLAEPRAAAVLELRRLGDRRLRAALHRVRVLDDRPARGLRARARTPGRGDDAVASPQSTISTRGAGG